MAIVTQHRETRRGLTPELARFRGSVSDWVTVARGAGLAEVDPTRYPTADPTARVFRGFIGRDVIVMFILPDAGEGE